MPSVTRMRAAYDEGFFDGNGRRPRRSPAGLEAREITAYQLAWFAGLEERKARGDIPIESEPPPQPVSERPALRKAEGRVRRKRRAPEPRKPSGRAASADDFIAEWKRKRT